MGKLSTTTKSPAGSPDEKLWTRRKIHNYSDVLTKADYMAPFRGTYIFRLLLIISAVEIISIK
jgi:hypothetical protein